MEQEYFEKYHREKNWYAKVILIEVYHFNQRDTLNKQGNPNGGWTISKTAAFFGLSIGLVSENLALAESFKKWPVLLTCSNRSEAIKKMNELVKGKSA